MVTVDHNAPAEMRDGTVLRADVYRPANAAACPVLLCRTPYDKAADGVTKTARELASKGYVVVVQDIRGRYASDGVYAWMFQDNRGNFDAQDGYDTVEWACNLSGCDGQVGAWGHSYPAWCAWKLAATRPPGLKALFPSGMSSRLRDLNFGIFETGRRLQWTYNMAVDARHRLGEKGAPRRAKRLTPGGRRSSEVSGYGAYPSVRFPTSSSPAWLPC